MDASMAYTRLRHRVSMRNTLEKRTTVVRVHIVVSEVHFTSLMIVVSQHGGDHSPPPSNHLHLHLPPPRLALSSPSFQTSVPDFVLGVRMKDFFIFSKGKSLSRCASRQGHGGSLPLLHKLIKSRFYFCFFGGGFLFFLPRLSLYVPGTNLASR